MFTSRAEFRLHLRIDNADRRLMPHGRRLGLVDDATWAEFEARQERGVRFKRALETTRVDAGRISAEVRAKLDGDGLHLTGQTVAEFLKRPEVGVLDVLPLLG